ncbi:MAG TPA: NAD-binding protein, partial [Vicinamibacterales bacterium]|nr:NAD-binding protein [Vicinamibacterales bacterium]
MQALPLIIVVGGEDLAVRACEELCSTEGHDVVLLADEDAALRRRIEGIGATFVGMAPNDYDSLRAAGIEDATSIIPVSSDDRLNLQVAVKARDLNPNVRIVLRQYNRALGRKIEQNLENCTVISPPAHAAATFAGASLDPHCFYALLFPGNDGRLFGFSDRLASQFGMSDVAPAEAERRLGARIVSVNGSTHFDDETPFHRRDRVLAFGPMERLQRARARRGSSRLRQLRRRIATQAVDLGTNLRRTEPLLLRLIAVGIAVYVAATAFFMARMHLGVVESLYFVASTMTTVGYGDITPYQSHAGATALLVATLLMFGGIAISGVFIATITAAINRAQQIALHGLRHIHAEDHVVVCGAGNVGTRLIDYLLKLDQRVVAIERDPNPLLMEWARDRKIDLLTGDATSDDTLAFCDLSYAKSLVATTDSDTANL